ncbi:hypothetical protein VQ042_25145, partial [Aurantimonas sp. A2-1-M11]
MPVAEDAEAEGGLAQIEPEPLDRVELGTVGRKRDEGDVRRYVEGLFAVPSGAVENHDGMDVVRNGVGELGEVEVHHRLVGIGQDQGEGLAGGGFDGAEDVGPVEALVAKPGWSLAAGPPAVAEAAFLANPCFVLIPERNPLVGVVDVCRFQGLGEPFFLKRAWRPGIALRVGRPGFLARKAVTAQDARQAGGMNTLVEPRLDP